jgi:hypothetical protein
MTNHERNESEETSQFQEVVPIEEARYLDPLEPQYEAYWRDLCDITQERGQSTDTVMVRIWNDEKIPQAFRDRAMLVMLNWKAGSALGISHRSGTVGMFQPITVAALRECTPHFNTLNFQQWIKEVAIYQKEKAQKAQQEEDQDSDDDERTKDAKRKIKKLVEEPLIFNWTVENYNDNFIDEHELEECIAIIGPDEARPYFRDYVDGGTWGSRTDVVDASDAFPVLANLLHPQADFPLGAPIRKWAAQKIRDYSAVCKGNTSVTLPPWLHEATEKQAFDLYTRLAYQYMQGNAGYVKWDIIQSGLQLYGASIFYRHNRNHGEDMIWNLSGKDELSAEEQEILQAVTTDVLEHRNLLRVENSPGLKPLTHAFIHTLESFRFIMDTQRYRQFVEDESKLTTQHDLVQKAEEQKRRDKREQDPEVIADKIEIAAAENRFKGLLSTIRVVSTSD